MKLSKNNPLRRPGYRYFILFHGAASIGGGFHFVASHWLLYDETKSPASTAWLVLSYLMPPLLLSEIRARPSKVTVAKAAFAILAGPRSALDIFGT